MPFKVVGKDDDRGLIFIDGQGPCSLPDGARADITPTTMFMLTHNLWDQIWYWPDRSGETYREVVDRFVSRHHEGEIVTGYLGGYRMDAYYAQAIPEWATSFKLSFAELDAHHFIYAQPVAAVAADRRSLIREYNPAIPAEDWLTAGPATLLRVEMVTYRWALTYGCFLLNWQDFAREKEGATP
jgi:hypothetical protein